MVFFLSKNIECFYVTIIVIHHLIFRVFQLRVMVVMLVPSLTIVAVVKFCPRGSGYTSVSEFNQGIGLVAMVATSVHGATKPHTKCRVRYDRGD